MSSEQLNLHGRDSYLIKFSDNFTGIPVIIIEAISFNNNVGKLYPMKVDKLFLINSMAFCVLIQLV
jgi:hypothetical protein